LQGTDGVNVQIHEPLDKGLHFRLKLAHPSGITILTNTSVNEVGHRHRATPGDGEPESGHVCGCDIHVLDVERLEQPLRNDMLVAS